MQTLGTWILHNSSLKWEDIASVTVVKINTYRDGIEVHLGMVKFVLHSAYVLL